MLGARHVGQRRRGLVASTIRVCGSRALPDKFSNQDDCMLLLRPTLMQDSANEVALTLRWQWPSPRQRSCATAQKLQYMCSLSMQGRHDSGQPETQWSIRDVDASLLHTHTHTASFNPLRSRTFKPARTPAMFCQRSTLHVPVN